MDDVVNDVRRNANAVGLHHGPPPRRCPSH